MLIAKTSERTVTARFHIPYEDALAHIQEFFKKYLVNPEDKLTVKVED